MSDDERRASEGVEAANGPPSAETPPTAGNAEFFATFASPAAESPLAEPLYVEPLVAALAPVVEPPPPRVWTALAVGVLTMPLAAFVSTVVLLLALKFEFGAIPRNRIAFQEIVERFATTKTGIVLMIAPGQIVFLFVAFAAACLSPSGWRRRLGLTAGRFPNWRWTWPMLALGTPMVGFLSSIAVAMLTDERSENLLMLQKLFQQQQGPFVFALYLLVGVLPGVAEEFLFRGYVQTRLAERFPAWVAIGVTAAMFSIAHFDPLHVVAVFPLGVWLGILAWRTGSIWPAVLAHAANNSLAIVMTRWGEVDPTNQSDLAQRGLVILGCGWALLIAIALLSLMRSPKASPFHV